MCCALVRRQLTYKGLTNGRKYDDLTMTPNDLELDSCHVYCYDIWTVK